MMSFPNTFKSSSNTTMASLSSSSSSDLIRLSSSLSLPKSCTKKISSKIENLVEYSYVPEGSQI